MPKPTTTQSGRTQRHEVILELIDGHYIRSQAELQELLESEGLEVNQGTLSRDLRELGVVKGPDGYELAPPLTRALPTNGGHGALRNAMRMWLISATPAQNLLVLKTPAGGAPHLALNIDQAKPPLAIGTVAGDDTILVICATAKRATKLANEFEAMR